MKRFKKILYVHPQAGGTEGAFARAVELARRNGAGLTVVNALKALPSELDQLVTGPSQEELKRLVVEEAAEALERLSKTAAAGLKVETKVLVGTRFMEIIREVLRGGHDLVVKPAEGGGGVKELLFGSIDMHLLRKCPCPVWITRPGEPRKYGSIMAAVDPTDEGAYELNYKIMDLATSLARAEGSRLHVAHAWWMIPEHLLRVRAGMMEDEVNMMASDAREVHRKKLLELMARCDFKGIDCVEHLMMGDPSDVIPELALKNKAELVVMGTVARTGVPGFIIGNTAEEILNRMECSVLVVKPDGFVTPVAPEG